MNVSEAVVLNITNKSLNIEGCCGGNCYVIRGIKYCPFCGKAIKFPTGKIEKVKRI